MSQQKSVMVNSGHIASAANFAAKFMGKRVKEGHTSQEAFLTLMCAFNMAMVTSGRTAKFPEDELTSIMEQSKNFAFRMDEFEVRPN